MSSALEYKQMGAAESVGAQFINAGANNVWSKISSDSVLRSLLPK